MTAKQTDTGGVVTVRTCSRCGARYAWPKGSRRPKAECPRCQPSLDQALADRSLVDRWETFEEFDGFGP